MRGAGAAAAGPATASAASAASAAMTHRTRACTRPPRRGDGPRAYPAVQNRAVPGSPRPRSRPAPGELEAARDLTVPDVVADDLRLLIVGINPGLWTAWAGHHFARPGNRFWAALHAGGLTDRVLDPSEERLLLERGIGITNMVPRTTAAAAELTNGEI